MLFMMTLLRNMLLFLVIMLMISHIESLILSQRDMELVCKNLELGKSINETINSLRERVAVGVFSKFVFQRSENEVEKLIRVIKNDLGDTFETRKNQLSGCSESGYGSAVSFGWAPEFQIRLPFFMTSSVGDGSSLASIYSSSYYDDSPESYGPHQETRDPLTVIKVEDSDTLEKLFKWMQNTFPVPCRFLKFPLFVNTNKPVEIRNLFISLAIQRQAIGIDYLRGERIRQMRDDFTCSED
ncbi:uncharacterized protein LOC141855630 [Brevipalpus obovatus]|uniref:uncharacterized protein LOC141855630 n=1 Tax=Brevipalpus obovatus TaxID=246614 RepID=UPI003D9F715A